MKKYLRKTLDWVELPFLLVYFLKLNKEQKELAKRRMNNFGCEWRKNSLSFKIAMWVLNIL